MIRLRSFLVVVYYNVEEQYLKKCLESILEQTLLPDEILLIDDGSSINYSDVLSTVGLSYSHWSFDSNKGLASRLNESIDYAVREGCDVYFRMDADDIMEPTRIEVQMAFMNSNSNIDIVGSNALVINSDGIPTGGVMRKYTNHEALSELIFFETPFVHPSICIRLKKHQWKYEDWPHSQDYATWIKLCKNLEYANIDQVLIRYRIGHSSTSKQHSVAIDRKYTLMRTLIKSVFPTWNETQIYRHYLWTNKDRLKQASPGFVSFVFWSYDIILAKGVSRIIVFQLLKRLYWFIKF